MNKACNHPAEWEVNWINDPKNHHHYRDEEHRMDVCKNIVHRTSLRCLNGQSIKIITDTPLPKNAEYSQDWRRLVIAKCNNVPYSIHVVALTPDEQMALELECLKKKGPVIDESDADDPMSVLCELLHNELGGYVVNRFRLPSRKHTHNANIVGHVGNMIVTYRIDLLFE